MTNQEKTPAEEITQLHLHEIVHGCALLNDMLDSIFSYRSGYLVEECYPEVVAAKEIAEQALGNLYQVVAGIDIPTKKESA